MGVAGLDWETIFVPFMAGLNQKSDVRALAPPDLDICKDVQFDKINGLQTRKPFVLLAGAGAIYGGDFLANCRKIFDNDGELIVLTDTALYSYSTTLQQWLLRGTHLAVKVDETPVFGTNSDQINPDRAELSNVVVTAWEDTGKVYVGAKDKTTGNVILAPTALSGTATRPRLVTLQTKIVLLYHNGTDASLQSVMAKAIDPANVATSIAAAPTTVLASPNFGGMYDVAAVPSQDLCIVVAQRAVTTSYSIIKLTAAMGVTAATKARTCDGPIAVSVTPDAASAQVVRASGTNIQGDLIGIAALTDTFTAQAIGTAATPTNQIAAAHRSVQNGGFYRCYCFWSSGENTANTGGFDTHTNWVDTNNALGTQASFVSWVGVASRAFDYNGSVYVWLTFGQTSGLGSGAANTSSSGEFQNSYFLHRDDGFLCAKAIYLRGGGLQPSSGRLPGVALTDGSTGYSWCATQRRIIAVQQGNATTGATHPNASTYSMRAPCDVAFAFDSNEARRMARFGRTLYITGGEILQYDGVGLYEVGFHVYPWYFDAIIQATGSIPNGLYGFKSTLRWTNAQGEIERSTTATVANATMTGGPSGLATTGVNVPLTHKVTNPAAIEVWRTQVNPIEDSPFYLSTSRDPSVVANPNRYLPNAPATGGFSPTMRDGLTDAQLTVGQESPEPGELPRLAPPAATLILSTPERLFLAGVAGDPHGVWYSRQRGDGELASFHGALRFDVPPQGGKITGLAYQEGTIVVFRERATYYARGFGFDNTGGGDNFVVSRVPGDLGAISQEGITVTDAGTVFHSKQGRTLLNRSFAFEQFGLAVEDYNADATYAAQPMVSQNQVRFLTNARMLVWDTFVQRWSEWTIADGVDACVWQGAHTYLTATGPKQQQGSFTGVDYGLDVEMAFVEPSGMQGYSRVRFLQILGEWASAHHLRVRVARDYRVDPNTGTWEYFNDKTWIPSPAQAGPEQVRHSPTIQQIQALKVRLTAYNPNGYASKQILVPGSSGTKYITITSKIPGIDGNAIVLSNDGGAGPTVPVITDGYNSVALSCSATTTFQQVCDAINASSALVSAVMTGDGSHVFSISGFAGNLAGGISGPTGEALKLTGLALEVGRLRGLYKRLPPQQRQ